MHPNLFSGYNEQGYSKHYYAGMERISSRIGGGLHDALQGEVIVDPLTYTVEHLSHHDDYAAISSDLLEMLNRNITCVEMDPSYVSMEESLHSVEQSTHQSDPEDNRYIYHSDHLGSSAFLTNLDGTPNQHMQYLPFGEPFIEQRSVTEYYTPYTFSAKERDLETGYSYFGARYYSSTLSIWLSMDPLSDKYPSMSAYMYCAGNPVMLVDPDGKEIGWIEDEKGNVFWDSNTNSKEEFAKNYAGNAGYSYVSDNNNPNSYTLPNGTGKLVVQRWTNADIENGCGGVGITLLFNPNDESAKTGWFQTITSNCPDVDSKTVWSTLPLENPVERLDGPSTISDRSDVNQAAYFSNPPSNILDDQPFRAKISGAKYDVTWYAQSSMIINGQKSFSVGWGFTITGEISGISSSPVILNSNTKFHNSAIEKLKK